ncbi:MAG: small subunit ribosomal protein [Chloroflexota bacterium]|jgi:small subunit ribosomal protein S6|nr:small subunit ribosomal protein [Chloroflexota bacterium]
MFILPTDLDEEGVTGATDRVRGFVSARGGEIHSVDLWGRRRLSYPIDRRSEGAYHVARFSMAPDQTADLDRILRLNEQILRHIIISVD